ncbi:hypothetical protein FF2_006161 [Malus domestica]
MPGFRSNPLKCLLLFLSLYLLVAFTSASSHISHTVGGRGDDGAGGSVIWETMRLLARNCIEPTRLRCWLRRGRAGRTRLATPELVSAVGRGCFAAVMDD